MDPKTLDLPSASTCTSCQFADDFSNYWTAVLYFRARNGTFHRVNQKPNVGFEQATGGMTVYYSSSYNGGKVTAFKPVSRFKLIPCYKGRARLNRVYQGLPHACWQSFRKDGGWSGAISPSHLYVSTEPHDPYRRNQTHATRPVSCRNHVKHPVPDVSEPFSRDVPGTECE